MGAVASRVSSRMLRLPTVDDDDDDDDTMAMAMGSKEKAPAVILYDAVPSSLVDILRVADEVEAANPRVAYLCRCHALQKAHRLDPNDPSASGSAAVAHFKTALLQRIQTDEEKDPTLKAGSSDAQEMKRFYCHYYKNYIQEPQNDANNTHRALLAEEFRTAAVLFEVLKSVILPCGNPSYQLHRRDSS